MKLHAEEIKALVASRDFAEAMLIADTIDWTRVRNVEMLTMVSDIYKINKKYEASRDVLLLAYERFPQGRKIVFSLCELSIKMDDFVQAVEYYKEFVQIAPKDASKYILQYKLYEAQNVSIEERIQVLEELKKHERREKWCYELAFLYHRIGLTTKCVEECDEIALWFGSGKYVNKALELKMLHEPLTASQQDKYNNRNKVNAIEKELEKGMNETDYEVRSFDANSKFNTIDIQKELAQSMEAIMKDTPKETSKESTQKSVTDDTIIFDKEENNTETQPQFDTIEMKVIDEFMQNETTLTLQTDGNMQELVMNSQPQTLEEEPVRHSSIVSNEEEFMKQEEVPVEFADKLSQEYDGQISLVVPENEVIEKQITGQLNIEDILTEWERIKRDLENKRAEEVTMRVKEQTKDVLYQFDVSSRETTLAEMEAVADAQIAKYGQETSQEFAEMPSSVEESIIGLQEMINDIDQETIEQLSILKVLNDTAELPSVEELTEIDSETDEENEVNSEEEVLAEFEESEEAEESEEIEDTASETNEDPEEDETGYTEDEVQNEPAATTFENEEKSEVHVQVNNHKSRTLTEDEQEIFGEAVNTDAMREQIATALDNISLASYTGNVIISGDAEAGTMQIAKNIIKNVQQTDGNFSGKIAKISGAALSNKDIAFTLDKLNNGALIIQKANGLEEEALEKIAKYLNQETKGIIVILEDTNKEIRKLMKRNTDFSASFTAKIDIGRIDNRILVKYGQKYAYEKEYSIDELAVLALHERISEMQVGQHVVSLKEVREMIDRAIQHANRKNIKHFFDIVFAKRYDAEDMIVLREKDFVC